VEDLKSENLFHFESLKKHLETTGSAINSEFFLSAIAKMHDSFTDRFKDFRNEKTTFVLDQTTCSGCQPHTFFAVSNS
jgi:hypothetical protein